MKPAASVIELPRFADASGNLCVLQESDHIPFTIGQVDWTYGPGNAGAGLDAGSRTSESVVVALTGRLRITVGSGSDERVVVLDRADRRLHVPPEHGWSVDERSPGGIALVLTAGLRDGGEALPASAVDDPGGGPDAGHSTVEDCAVIELSLVHRRSGHVTSLRSGEGLSSRIRRIYYLTDIPEGATRGGHADRELHQFLVAVNGSFEVDIDDGLRQRRVLLSRPDQALHLVPGIWRDLRGFSDGSVCLVLASHPYREEDYLREHDEFLAFKSR